MYSEDFDCLDELTPEEEELLGELIEEYSDLLYANEIVLVEDYLKRCPDEKTAMAFTIMSNMVQLLDITESLKGG